MGSKDKYSLDEWGHDNGEASFVETEIEESGETLDFIHRNDFEDEYAI